MLVIAVSHGYNTTKAYTQTFRMRAQDVTVVTLRNVLQFIDKQYSADVSQLDEVLVIEDDKILYHYTEQDLNDDYEEIDEAEFEIVEKVA